MTDRLISPLPPMTNPWVLGLATAQVIDAETTSRILSTLENGLTDEVQALIDPAVHALHLANAEYFRFDLSGAVGADEPKLIRFERETSLRRVGLGLQPNTSDRKLVALLVLAVTGADARLVLDQPPKSTAPQPGMLVVVPAYCDLVFDGDEDGRITVAAFHAYGRAFR